MRRLPLALLLAASLGATAPAEAIAPPARVQVVATEFNFGLSRQSIKSGWALIDFVNGGEDPHNLRLQRVGGTRVYMFPTLAPGDNRMLRYKLLPGKFRLWCSIADHRALGMTAALTVRR